MNGRIAKRLRREALEMVGNNRTKYRKSNVKPMYHDDFGNATRFQIGIKSYWIYDTYTASIAPGCTRLVYKNLKRQYKAVMKLIES